MKSVIMAGGEGSRLRPLTCACPKPMVPIFDRPIMRYALELLKKHGIHETAVTLMYLPQSVKDYFGTGDQLGMRLEYFTEDAPLGTAGSVLRAKDALDDTFLVLSGDGLTDLDLTAAWTAHKQSGAMATMVLKRVHTPIEYGVVVIDQDKRVTRFVEKPDWGEVPSDLVNTGIYILEKSALGRVARDRAVDFGRELFPKLVESGAPVYAYIMDGYWCDVGDQAAYRRAHMDLLDGAMRVPFIAPGTVNRQGADIDMSAVLEAPCYIGRDAHVGPGAHIGPYAVLGAGSYVGAHASVKRAILWRGARADELTQLRGTVLLSGARMLRESAAFEESALGDQSTLGIGATLMPGARVWPGKTLGDHEKIDRNIVWGACEKRMENGAFVAESPACMVLNAQAYADALNIKTVMLGRDMSSVSLAYARAASAGLMAQGARVLDIGPATINQLRYAQEMTHAEGALFVERERMTPLDELGAPIARDARRKIASRVRMCDFAAPFSAVTRMPVHMSGTDIAYVARLADDARATCGVPVALYGAQETQLALGERALRACNIPVRGEWEEELMELAPGEIGAWLNDTGESVRFSDAQGLLTDAQGQLARAWVALEMGVERLVAQRGMTRALDQLADIYHTEVVWTDSDTARFQRILAMEDSLLFRLHNDGVFLAMCMSARLFERELTLPGLRRMLPNPKRRTRTLAMEPRDKGALFRELSDMLPDADASDGIAVTSERGWAWIDPAGDQKKCTVVAESLDAEYAKELCDFFSARIEELQRARKCN